MVRVFFCIFDELFNILQWYTQKTLQCIAMQITRCVSQRIFWFKFKKVDPISQDYVIEAEDIRINQGTKNR